ALDGHVACRPLHGRAGTQHLALAGAIEIAAELLVDRHAAEDRSLAAIVGRLGRELHLERSSRAARHVILLVVGKQSYTDFDRRRRSCSSATASSRTPRRISSASTAANPS